MDSKRCRIGIVTQHPTTHVFGLKLHKSGYCHSLRNGLDNVVVVFAGDQHADLPKCKLCFKETKRAKV